MGINQIDNIPSMDASSLPALQKILKDNADQTEGVIFRDTVPEDNEVPLGKKIIYDDGAGTKRVYWRTAQGNVFYVTVPVTPGVAVADATGAGDVVAQLNALLASLRGANLIET